MKRLAAGLAAVLVLALSSCGFSRDDDLVWAQSLEPHQCADRAPSPSPSPSTAETTTATTDEVALVRVVKCENRHVLEVYAQVTYQDEHRQPSSVPEAKYPGQEDLVRFGREACAGRYRGYLGDGAPSPDQYLTFLYPSVTSWTAFGAARPKLSLLETLVGKAPPANRFIVCMVQSAGAENLTGSVATPENGKTS